MENSGKKFSIYPGLDSLHSELHAYIRTVSKQKSVYIKKSHFLNYSSLALNCLLHQHLTYTSNTILFLYPNVYYLENTTKIEWLVYCSFSCLLWIQLTSQVFEYLRSMLHFLPINHTMVVAKLWGIVTKSSSQTHLKVWAQ